MKAWRGCAIRKKRALIIPCILSLLSKKLSRTIIHILTKLRVDFKRFLAPSKKELNQR